MEDFGTIGFGNFKDYFYFKPGSFWIYENNRTGELDTCTIVSMSRDTVTLEYETADFKRLVKQEKINFVIYTNHRNGVVNYWTTNPCLGCIDYDSTFTISKYMRGGNVFYIPWNKYPSYCNYYPSMVIGGQTYNDIYRFDLEMDDGLPFWDDTKLLWGGQNGSANFSSYYWARNYGLVRLDYKKYTSKNILDSASWILKYKDIKAF